MIKRFIGILVAALFVAMSISVAAAGSTVGEGLNDGIAADTTPPAFIDQHRTPSYPSPSSKVDITAVVKDESSPLSVRVAYGLYFLAWAIALCSAAKRASFNSRCPAS